MINWGTVPLNSVLPFVFDTFAGSTGAPITLTGLATTDIEVYKGTSMTQRASDNGYALMDTDGIDIDTRTGIHGFSIDTSDNSDAGFYAAGSFYWVIVDAVTIDAQTVRFIAGTFRLSGVEADVAAILDDTADMQPKLGTPAGASISADIAAIEAQTDDIGIAGAGLTALGDARLANLDAAVSSRLASASYTAPDNTSITAIKAKTDSLTFTKAGEVDANIKSVNDVTVTGDGQAGTEWGPT